MGTEVSYMHVRLYDPMPQQPDIYFLRITNAIVNKGDNSLSSYNEWDFVAGEWVKKENPHDVQSLTCNSRMLQLTKPQVMMLGKVLKQKGLVE